MIKQFIDGEWVVCDVTPTDTAGIYRKYHSESGYCTWTPSFIDEAAERAWLHSELTRTDTLVLLPDYPYKQELLEYRAELRDYDFSGTRPDVPTTKNGTKL